MATDLPELAELNQIRLDDDMSYDQLAAAVTEKSGFRVTGGGLHRLIAGKRQPTDRTLHKIRRFLDARKEAASAEAHS